MVSWRLIGLVFLAFLGVLASSYVQAETADQADYPLDGIARVLDDGEDLPCADQQLVVYRGTTIKMSKPARVHPAFAPKIAELEQIVAEVALPIYGRAPRTLVHLGTHNCRRMRLYPDWVSEHALGNAIDVAGFDFGPLPKQDLAPQALPRSLKRGFSVRLDQHWRAQRGAGATHSAFLRALALRLIRRPDLFRVVLGPAWPGHHNHFHLDFAPYRVVEVFKPGEVEAAQPTDAY
jgi:hypothetical protein